MCACRPLYVGQPLAALPRAADADLLQKVLPGVPNVGKPMEIPSLLSLVTTVHRPLQHDASQGIWQRDFMAVLRHSTPYEQYMLRSGCAKGASLHMQPMDLDPHAPGSLAGSDRMQPHIFRMALRYILMLEPQAGFARWAAPAGCHDAGGIAQDRLYSERIITNHTVSCAHGGTASHRVPVRLRAAAGRGGAARRCSCARCWWWRAAASCRAASRACARRSSGGCLRAQRAATAPRWWWLRARPRRVEPQTGANPQQAAASTDLAPLRARRPRPSPSIWAPATSSSPATATCGASPPHPPPFQPPAASETDLLRPCAAAAICRLAPALCAPRRTLIWLGRCRSAARSA